MTEKTFRPFSVLFITLALLLASSHARSDQELAKGRLDDCFRDAEELMSDSNSHFGRGDQWKFNAAFDKKKSQCYQLKGEYEQKYGKYIVPGTQLAKTKSPDLSKLSPEDLISNYCQVYSDFQFSQDQIDMQRSDRANVESVKVFEKAAASDQRQMKTVRAVYKKKTGRILYEGDCDPHSSTDGGILRKLKSYSVCNLGRCVSADKDPYEIERQFCTASDDEKQLLNKLHRKLTGDDAFCKP